jgi:hypothetical protein
MSKHTLNNEGIKEILCLLQGWAEELSTDDEDGAEMVSNLVEALSTVYSLVEDLDEKMIGWSESRKAEVSTD